MITGSEIRQKAERKYTDFLKYKIACNLNGKTDDEAFFPLHIKADKGKANDDLQKYEQEITPLYEQSKTKQVQATRLSLKKSIRAITVISRNLKTFFLKMKKIIFHS